MTDEEIVKVTRILVGGIKPIADSSYDSKIIPNIEKMGNVISCLLADVGYMACDSFDSPFASEAECGKLGYRILRDIRNEVDNYLSDIEVEINEINRC